MGMLEVSGDFARVADGLEPVTLRTPGSSAVTAVAGALRRAVSIAEAASSGGQYTAADVVWHLPVEQAAVQPAIGSAIVDAAGTVWTILEVRKETLGSRWRCRARDLAVAHGLNTQVTIEKSSTVKGAAGAAEYIWNVYRAGVRARIQPESSQVVVENDQRGESTVFRIYLAEQIPVDSTHRVVDSSGAIYQVEGYVMPERVDALAVIQAIRPRSTE